MIGSNIWKRKKRAKHGRRSLKRSACLTRKFMKKIDKSDVNEERLYDQILKLAKNSIKNSHILDIRLFDEETKELYFAKEIVFSSSRGTKQEIEERRKKRFLTNPKAYKKVPLGVLVYTDGIPRSNADVENYHSETFPENATHLDCSHRGDGRHYWRARHSRHIRQAFSSACAANGGTARTPTLACISPSGKAKSSSGRLLKTFGIN